MSKWADYLVSAVRYDETKTRIELVTLHKDEGSKVVSPFCANREDFFTALRNGQTAITIHDKDGQWKKGKKISIHKCNGSEFIRTDNNSINQDSLDQVKEF